jgi:hypothetical protein
MPRPDIWFHQLKDREERAQTAAKEVGTEDWTGALPKKSEADPAQFRTGGGLREALYKALTDTRAGIAGAPAKGKRRAKILFEGGNSNECQER